MDIFTGHLNMLWAKSMVSGAQMFPTQSILSEDDCWLNLRLFMLSPYKFEKKHYGMRS